jgi:hypothetical protein
MSFKQIGKHILKGNFGLATKTMIVDVVNSVGYRGSGANSGGMWFFGNNGIDLHFSYSTHQSAIDAYQKCAPVSAIINKKAQAFINGKVEILNSNESPATSTDAKKLKKLLKKPNPLQSWSQFEAQAYIYQQLFGFTMWLPIKPAGFPNIEATSLWNIPPYMLDIKESKQLFYENPKIIQKIILTYKDIKTELNPEDVAIIEDFTPNFTSLIIPQSRLKGVSMPINNIIGAYEGRNTLINYRGALGILTPDTDSDGMIPLSPKDKEDLQYDFSQYGIRQQQWQVIISNAALKWQQMGYATKDLMLFEEIEDDIMRICDAYNYPYRLLSSEKSASYNDVKEFKKFLYQDAIIPEANSFYEQINQFFNLENYNLLLKKNFSSVAILQDDIKAMADSRSALSTSANKDFLMNIITLNQYREIVSQAGIVIPSTADGNVYYSDIKDKIGVAKVGAGQMHETDNTQE